MRYARSPEVKDRFDESKIEKLSTRSRPSSTISSSDIERSDWTPRGRQREYAARALGAGLTLSTLLIGINAETEAGGGSLRNRVDEQHLACWRAPCRKSRRSRSSFIHHAITVTRRESEQVQQRWYRHIQWPGMGVVNDQHLGESEDLQPGAVTSAAARRSPARRARWLRPPSSRLRRCVRRRRPPPA